MARFRLDLEYEGTRYRGWQVQANARTVQGEIQDALKKIFPGETTEFMGSGRTDAGVHAIHQAAHLDVKTVLAPEIIRLKLNDLLPADINIIEVAKANPGFHARHDAVARCYLYQIARRRTAFGKRYVWWIKDRLDVAAMKSAADLLTGMNNFQSFTADDPEDKSTRVLIESVELVESGHLVLIRFTGSHFLWKMIRQIVGVLAEVGRGSMSEDDLRKFLAVRTGEPARFTAPPSGLFLERVCYPGEPRPGPVRPVLNI